MTAVRGFYVKSLTGLALAIFGFLSFSVALDRRPLQEVGEELAYLPKAKYLKPALLGFEHLAADLFWLEAIQYFGKHYEADRRYPKLYPLVDLVTSLDPQFLDAFRLGALFLTIARQYPEAITIYEKGIAQNPDWWELPHDLGRLYYLELKDYPRALTWWERTAKLPGHPHYIPRFVARLYAQTGHLETALELWQEMYGSTDNEWVRETARQEIERLLEQLKRERGR